MNKNLLNLLNNVTEDGEFQPENERILLIDGLNLFFRNFSAINAVNSKGIHIGGLGGFFRSLGFLINNIQPTKVYMLMDGVESSSSRKNIIPEYKGGRNQTRITKHELFDTLDEEDDSKVNQIVRIIQYLQTLPVVTIAMPRVEADDVIAYLSEIAPTSPDDRVFIVSSDKDYLQLVSDQVIVYRPIEKEYYTKETVVEKFGVTPHNFILYKLLMGDNSDKIQGIKGLGPKKLFKYFPELKTQDLSFQDLIDLSESKLEEHVIYAQVLHNIKGLEDNYKVMDLSNPMMSEDQKIEIQEIAKTPQLEFYPSEFIQMCHEDQLGNLIRNVEIWVMNTFKDLLPKS
jgi:5'-3' exonuclease